MPILPISFNPSWDMGTVAGLTTSTPHSLYQLGESDVAPTNMSAAATAGRSAAAIGGAGNSALAFYFNSLPDNPNLAPPASAGGSYLAGISYDFTTPPQLFPSSGSQTTAYMFQNYAVYPTFNQYNPVGIYPFFAGGAGLYIHTQTQGGVAVAISFSWQLFTSDSGHLHPHFCGTDGFVAYASSYPWDDYSTGGYLVKSSASLNDSNINTNWITPGVPDTSNFFRVLIDRPSAARWINDINALRVSAGNFNVGFTYVITSVGTTNFVAIGASSNTVGVQFVATGVGSGTGQCSFVQLSTDLTLMTLGSYGVNFEVGEQGLPSNSHSTLGICYYAPSAYLVDSITTQNILSTLVSPPSWSLSDIRYRDNVAYQAGRNEVPTARPTNKWYASIAYNNDTTNDLDIFRPPF